MKQITTTKGTFLFVQVPDGAYEFSTEIDFMEDWYQIIYHRDIDDEESGFYGECYQDNIELPQGNWQFINTCKDISEEQAKEVVDESIHTGLFGHYVKGIPLNTYCYKTASEAFQSLLQANEIPENSVVLKLIES